MPSITRRDFLNGVLWTSVGTSLGWPMEALSQAIDPTLASPHATPLATPLASATSAPPGAFYPPALTGLRGSHPGAFEAAHTLAWTGQLPAASTVQTDANVDCVIIGAGISGLSAALFYLEEIDETARILILDNHDDFGGHAKRNEFTVDGLTLISYGGTQSFDTPSAYSKVSRRLLASLGIDLRRLHQAYDQEFFDRLEVGPGIYCDAATFGKAALLIERHTEEEGVRVQYFKGDALPDTASWPAGT